MCRSRRRQPHRKSPSDAFAVEESKRLAEAKAAEAAEKETFLDMQKQAEKAIKEGADGKAVSHVYMDTVQAKRSLAQGLDLARVPFHGAKTQTRSGATRSYRWLERHQRFPACCPPESFVAT